MSATIRDVARRAGVSTATVSRVLSGASASRPETIRRVIEAADELRWRPSRVARSLKTRSTRTLGLLLTDLSNPFYPELVRGVENAAREIDYGVVLCNGDDDPEREAAYLEMLLERRVDGIVVAASRITERHGRWLAAAPIPIVVLNSEPRTSGIPAALSDNAAGGRLAAEHVLRLGHRRIGYVTAPDTPSAEERLAGAREALAAAGQDPNAMPLAMGDSHVEGGEAATSALLAAAPGLTAVLCHNDLTAIGALRALRAAGRRVPHDVSVVGFDDIDLCCWVEPSLTTVAQPTGRLGRWAVEAIVNRLAGGAEEPAGGRDVVRFPVELRERGSTAPAIVARATTRCDPPHRAGKGAPEGRPRGARRQARTAGATG